LVLVVDDYADTQELYREFLSYAGFRVAAAASGQEAVDLALSLLPDLILMDLSLPGMDGWEATRRIRRDPRTRNVAIVALSGHTTGSASASAKRAGCDSFLTKPCLPADLVAHIRRVLDEKQKS
jgi:CheY-like chemotaxis protein